MKVISATLMGLTLTTGLFAQTLPEAPRNCERDLAFKGFCSSFAGSTETRGAITLTVFAAVEKYLYPDFASALERMTSFEKWPAYNLAGGNDNMHYKLSVGLPGIYDKQGNTIFRHYMDYSASSPFGTQSFRSLTHYVHVAPYQGTLGSIEFEVQNQGYQDVPDGERPLNGAEGVRQFSGVIHLADCAQSDLCTDDYLLLMYQASIRPEFDLLPSLIGPALTKSTVNLFIGMFLMDDSIDPDVLF